MSFQYEVNGHVVEFDNEPNEQDIDEAASQLGSTVSHEQSKPPIDFGEVAHKAGQAMFNPSEGLDIAQRTGQAALSSLYGQAREAGNKMIPDSFKENIGNAVQSQFPPLGLMPKGGEKAVGGAITGLGIDALAGLATGGALKLGGMAKNSAVNAVKAPFKFMQVAEREIGQNITPRVQSIIESRMKSMEPEALRVAGVPEESIKFSNKVKGLTSIKELPTTEEGDKYFQKVIEGIPDDVEIQPEHFRKAAGAALSEIESGLGKEHPIAKSIRGMLTKMDTPKMDINTLQSEVKPLNKETFIATRRDINRLFGGNDEFNRFVQPMKEALDKDASIASGGNAPMGRARIMYRLPRELSKANKYIDKQSFPQTVQDLLEKAQKPGEVQTQELLKKLLGPDSEEVLKSLGKNRFNKNVPKIASMIGGAGAIGYLLRRVLGNKVMHSLGE